MDILPESLEEIFFSVVIPTYNAEKKLLRAVDSVLKQDYKNFEILVIDDGSTDNTSKVLEEIEDPRLKYFWQTNSGGPAKPRNKGIELSSGGWISFLDADDLWYPMKLRIISEAIKRNHRSVLFCHNEKLLDKRRPNLVELKHGPFEEHFYKKLLISGNRLSTSAVTVKRDYLVDNNLLFNESSNFSIVEDYDLWLRIANKGAEFIFIDDVLGEYHIDGSNISLVQDKEFKNYISLIKFHVYFIQTFDASKMKLFYFIVIKNLLCRAIYLLKRKEYIKCILVMFSLRQLFSVKFSP